MSKSETLEGLAAPSGEEKLSPAVLLATAFVILALAGGIVYRVVITLL
jgi:hypothetical protein